jgi:signal transduction histidine kinase
MSSPSADQEMVELVSTLNGFLHRLSESVAVQGRFYAAASHELRTPLQALSGHLGLGLSSPRSSEEYRAILQEAHRQARRLKILVQDLLLLS